MPNSLTEKNENHVIVLVHGIRDFAYWQVEIRQSLEAHGFAVELTNYERFDLVRFLAPIPWFRNTVIEKIWKQIEQIYQLHPGKKISFIAHSFGTYVLAEIMQRKFNFVANRIIFCGSVARYDAPLEQITNRFEPPLLNEVGTRDIWPAIAQSLTFGYGSAGSYGFKRPNVRDRWHAHADHGYFLNSEFCTRFWVPFLEDGKIVPAESKPQQPSWWVRLIYIVQIKFIVVGFIGLLAYLIPWQRLNSYPVEQWVVVAEEARRAGTVHASRPMPNTLVQARSAFEAWWNDTGFKGRKALPADLVYKALTYNARLYRIFERQDEMKPNSNYWNEQCLSYFEQIQNSDKVTECLLDMSALYLDLSQIQHTNPDNFRRVAEDGHLVMVRAAALADDNQKAEVNRIASRFYYNLARPRDGLLSSPWNNNYLTLAIDRAKEAHEKDGSDIRNVTQLCRSVQRMAANPPQINQIGWTERLRQAQKLMAKEYREKQDRLRTPRAHIPPANILAVITMDLVRRDWTVSTKRMVDAERAIDNLQKDSLSPQTNAWALIRSTEWAKDYTFDLNYDLARIRSVAVQIMDEVGFVGADGMFEDALSDMKAAVRSASAIQLQAAFNSLSADPSFSGLSEARRSRFRAILSIQ